MLRAIVRPSTIMLLFLASFVFVSGSVSAQAASLSGDVPADGGFGLVTFGGGTIDDLDAAAAVQHCSLVSAWVTSAAQWVGHAIGAPVFVNRGFAAIHPGTIPASTPILIVCAGDSEPPAPAPDPPPPAPGGSAVLLLLDEDAIDNGLFYRLSPTIGVQNIFPDNSIEFGSTEVNDNRASEGLRDVLPFFAARQGQTLSMLSGQTGDEGWFAPSCIPARWLAAGSGEACITDPAQRQQAITRFVTGAVPQDVLDGTPGVRPLRALGLAELVGTTVCAVVYDSDISINYDSGAPFTRGGLQGENYGLVAFTVLDAVRLTQFSSSSLAEVQLRIENATQICSSSLFPFDAPIPSSSSEPDDVDPERPSGEYRNR